MPPGRERCGATIKDGRIPKTLKITFLLFASEPGSRPALRLEMMGAAEVSGPGVTQNSTGFAQRIDLTTKVVWTPGPCGGTSHAE